MRKPANTNAVKLATSNTKRNLLAHFSRSWIGFFIEKNQ